MYIEPPPQNSRPEHVLKYLARYLTGGPISDRRLIAHQDGQVTFWARSKDKTKGNPAEPYTLPGVEFTRRWALHILPKGFVNSRCFGGFSGRRRARYLADCRRLLDCQPPVVPEAAVPEEEPLATLACPQCAAPMACVAFIARPSWRWIFQGGHGLAWYHP